MAIGSSKKQGLIVPLEFDNTKEIAIAMTNVTDVELSTNGEDIEMVSTSKGSKRNFTDPYHSTLNFNIETLLTAEVLVHEIDNGGTIEEKIYSNLDTLFLQSDFKREHVGEDKVIYTPDSNAASEFTLKFVKENVLRNVKGAKGSSTISGTVGKPLAIMFINMGATVTVCNSKTKSLDEKTRNADILIACVGQKHFIKKEMVKPGAVVIDVGINRVDGKICGDVDFDEVSKIASYITPVPGGVGPMTVAMLFKNCMNLYKKNRGEK